MKLHLGIDMDAELGFSMLNKTLASSVNTWRACRAEEIVMSLRLFPSAADFFHRTELDILGLIVNVKSTISNPTS